MKYGLTTLALVLITGTAWAISDYIIPVSVNYKITVEVDTPEGIKTGSAVRRVTAVRQPAPLPENNPVSVKLEGEAVVVDLGERGKLFALIDSYYGYDDLRDAFLKKFTQHNETLEFLRSLKIGDSAMLTEKKPPVRMVTFSDLNDYQTITGVSSKNIQELFGENVSVNNVSITITDERVTKKIEGHLPKGYKLLKQGFHRKFKLGE